MERNFPALEERQSSYYEDTLKDSEGCDVLELTTATINLNRVEASFH